MLKTFPGPGYPRSEKTDDKTHLKMCVYNDQFIYEYEHTMTVKVFVITLFIFLPCVCGLVENLFATHSTDRTYQGILHNEHHQENQKNSLLNGITSYGLQLKKHATIETISENFEAKWLNVLHEAQRKLVNLLLEETQCWKINSIKI